MGRLSWQFEISEDKIERERVSSSAAARRWASSSSDAIEFRQGSPHDCHVSIRPVGNGKLNRYAPFTLKENFVGELARIDKFCITDQISGPMVLLMRAKLIFGGQLSATA